MRKYFGILFMALLFVCCNKNEGQGGSSAIEGHVYNVIHTDDNFSFTTTTVDAVKEDVFIVFGDAGYFGDDVETDRNGLYRFEYLRKGHYTVYAYSEYADGRKEAVSIGVSVGSGTAQAGDIYIHTGKANGTAMIKGMVWVQYYDHGWKVAEGPGVETRVYIKHYGEETHFDDVRAGDLGIFIFQKILPGKYEIWVATQDKTTEQLTPLSVTVEVTETGKMYLLPDRFVIDEAI
jgi:hypothetical protein